MTLVTGEIQGTPELVPGFIDRDALFHITLGVGNHCVVCSLEVDDNTSTIARIF